MRRQRFQNRDTSWCRSLLGHSTRQVGTGRTAIQSKIRNFLYGPLTKDTTGLQAHLPVSNVLTTHLNDEVDLEQFLRVESMEVEEPSMTQA